MNDGSNLLQWAGIASGTMFGWGLLVVIGRLRARRVRLDERVGPYLRVLGTTSALLQESTARSAFQIGRAHV